MTDQQIMSSAVDDAQEILRLKASNHDLLHILKRILAAHDSQNNGAVNGEAVLCRMFADLARIAIDDAERDKEKHNTLDAFIRAGVSKLARGD